MKEKSSLRPPVRLIPRLDIKGPNVVKGIHLEGLRVIGRPESMAKYYYDSGADELLFMDIVASLYERNSLKEVISRTAEQVFIPITVGGGLRTIQDISDVLHAGADKVCLNTAAIRNPSIIAEAARVFGSSTVVIAIEAIRDRKGVWLAYTDNGREYTGQDAIDWAKQVADMGAGEIVLTSVDQEGTGAGFDLELISLITENSSIPVIAHGGAGAAADINAVVLDASADAVSIASILHYGYIELQDRKPSEYTEGNLEFLKRKESVQRFSTATISEIKGSMHDAGIPVRLEAGESKL